MSLAIALVTRNIGCDFAKGIQEQLKILGHDVLRTTKPSPKRVNIQLDVNPPAIGKARQFEKYKTAGVRCVPFTTHKVEAIGWALEDSVVVCRTLDNANSGRGIVLASSPEDIVQANLYTRYIPKKREFRVHVFRGAVIHIQEKKLRQGYNKEEVNFKIRNADNGWIFCHKDLDIPSKEDLVIQAERAVAAIGYVFGAVDIIYNEKHNKYYVLEVNSRPGVEGTTGLIYAEAFLRYHQENGSALEDTHQKYVSEFEAKILNLIQQSQQVTGAIDNDF